MTGPERDDEFDAYLRQRSGLHRRVSELERLEPPEDLDRIVLRRARQAIQPSSQVPMYRAPRWALPAGLVAILVLSFAIVLDLSVHKGKPEGVVTLAMPTAPRPALPPAVQTDAAKTEGAAAPRLEARELPSDRQGAPGRRAKRDATATAIRPDPAAWLRRIDELRAQGRTAEAARELRHFHEAYPDYSPPATPAPADGPTK